MIHLNMNKNNNKKIAKQDHDHVKGLVNLRASVLINWFPVQTCYVQLIFVITMQCWKKKKSHKGLSNPSILSMP